jgi:hypothetical protein
LLIGDATLDSNAAHRPHSSVKEQKGSRKPKGARNLDERIVALAHSGRASRCRVSLHAAREGGQGPFVLTILLETGLHSLNLDL